MQFSLFFFCTLFDAISSAMLHLAWTEVGVFAIIFELNYTSSPNGKMELSQAWRLKRASCPLIPSNWKIIIDQKNKILEKKSNPNNNPISSIPLTNLILKSLKAANQSAWYFHIWHSISHTWRHSTQFPPKWEI